MFWRLWELTIWKWPSSAGIKARAILCIIHFTHKNIGKEQKFRCSGKKNPPPPEITLLIKNVLRLTLPIKVSLLVETNPDQSAFLCPWGINRSEWPASAYHCAGYCAVSPCCAFHIDPVHWCWYTSQARGKLSCSWARLTDKMSTHISNKY